MANPNAERKLWLARKVVVQLMNRADEPSLDELRQLAERVGAQDPAPVQRILRGTDEVLQWAYWRVETSPLSLARRLGPRIALALRILHGCAQNRVIASPAPYGELDDY